MTPTYTLSELVHIVEQWFRELFGGFGYWCQAEVMKIKQHKSRVYIDLVQYDTAGNVLAKARGIIRELSVLSSFCRQTGLKISELEGMTIMMKATSNFHHQRGFSLSISEISAQHTLWQLKQVQQSITQTLKDADLYDRNKKTQYGPAPMRVAVISSQTSEWYKDFQTVLESSEVYIESELYISAVHGNAAKIEVAAALRRIHASFDAAQTSELPYSAVCIMRGWWWWEWFVRQNDLEIAKLICTMPVPVIVAIWHTSDTSILDEVSFHAAKTPTDAGYFLIEHVSGMVDELDEIYSDITSHLADILYIYEDKVQDIYTQIQAKITLRHETYTSQVEHMREQISSFRPESMLSKWYILAKQEGIYMKIADIHSLPPWSQLELQTWVGSIQVQVQ